MHQVGDQAKVIESLSHVRHNKWNHLPEDFNNITNNTRYRETFKFHARNAYKLFVGKRSAHFG